MSESIADRWTETMAEGVSDQLGFPAAFALDDYLETESFNSIEEMLALLDVPAIVDMVNEFLLDASDIYLWLEPIEAASGRSLCSSEEVAGAADWCNDNDADWSRAAEGLALAAADLRDLAEEIDTRVLKAAVTTGSSLVRAYVGDVEGALWEAVSAASTVTQMASSDGEHRAARRWDLEVARFFWSTTTWRLNARRTLAIFYGEGAEAALEGQPPEVVANIHVAMLEGIRAIQADVQARTIDYSAGRDTGTCPHCGTSWGAAATYCTTCEVAL